MQLFEHVKEVLSKNESFCKDGKLFKNNVVEAALKLDTELLSILLKDDTSKKHFFITVEGVQVFDKVKFQQFVSNKQFLPDSYTTFKNKIGLTANGDYLTEANEVVLDFPYKDCVLEGGQTKEDQKRKEIFWNETLASDEIDRLFEPKVLTNWKKYDKKGEHVPTSVTDKDNLIIKGNNLLALQSLVPKFKGKINLVYLDPPYNTGGDGFNYNDRFTHSAWLTFMRNRLELTRRLMAKDGLIVLQIDSSRNNKNGRIGSPELGYLHVLMDEVFGRKNFVGHLHWKKKKQPSFLSKVAGIMESIIIYAKDESLIDKLQIGNTSDTTTRVDNSDNNVSEALLLKGIRCMGKEEGIIKSGVYQNKTMSTEFLDDVKIKDGRTLNPVRVKAKFRTTKEEIKRFCELDLIYITEKNSLRRFKTEEEKSKGKTITDLLLDWGQNQDATNELRELFDIKDDSKPFDTPKPELLIHNIITACSKEGDIILDYFSGSGTTQAVSHKLSRQYIGVEQLDYINTIVVERLKKVISGEQGGVSKTANWKGGGSFVYAELAENATSYISKIEALNNSKEAIALWNELKEEPFISYRVSPSEFDANIESFEQLALDDQKKLLISTIDKNHLYINYADIEDKTYNISGADKKLNLQFYNR